MSEQRVPERIIVGGLHEDDFQLALDNEPLGYVLIAFRLSVDRYHWEAVYEENVGQFP